MHTNTNTLTHTKREKQNAESTRHDYSVATPTEEGRPHRWRRGGKKRRSGGGGWSGVGADGREERRHTEDEKRKSRERGREEVQTDSGQCCGVWNGDNQLILTG
jgi:hypothetical protein